MAHKGFARGDFDTSFHIDSKFESLRRSTDRATYHVCTSVWWHFVAATWREGQRVTIQRATDATPGEVALLREHGLVGADGRLPRRGFAGWIGVAIERRRAAADRQARRRADESSPLHDRKRTSIERKPSERLSRVRARESGQDRYIDSDYESNGEETNPHARAPEAPPDVDLDLWARVVLAVERVSGSRSLINPHSRLGERALELVGAFGFEPFEDAIKRIVVDHPHPSAGQLIFGADNLLRPIPTSAPRRLMTPEQREQAEARNQIQADVRRARGGHA